MKPLLLQVWQQRYAEASLPPLPLFGCSLRSMSRLQQRERRRMLQLCVPQQDSAKPFVWL